MNKLRQKSLSTRLIQDAYLGSDAMRSTSSSIALVGSVLGFDIVELWSEGEDKKLKCIYVYATDDFISRYPSIIVGYHPQHKREHVLSPQLCRASQLEPNRCYWKTTDVAIEESKKLDHSIIPIPVKTEMCYWAKVDSEDLNIFIVGLSLSPQKFSDSKIQFLCGIGHAIVVSYDIDDDEVTGVVVNDLDNKEFVPRPISTPFSSVANLAGANSYTQLSSLNISSRYSASSLDVGLPLTDSPDKTLKTARGSESAVHQANSDFSETFRLISTDAEDATDIMRSISTATIDFNSQPDETTIVKLSSGPSSGFIPTSNPPTWLPGDAFSFPVAEIPVRCWVPDNLSLNHFSGLNHVADGSNSHIYVGNLDGVGVVVKIIKETVENDSVAIHEFEVEHGILIRLNHPHIIKLLGAGRTPRRFIVLEYLGGGTLNTILAHNHPTGIASKFFRKPSFTYNHLLGKLRDIADAFDYLNTKVHMSAMILHRDLKPDNVGFSQDGILKLFDFGLCTCVRKRTFDSESYEMTGNTGSLRYMAPEVALRRPYNEKADVYSFGIMAWQMARDKVPFKGMNKEAFLQSVVLAGERPALDRTWPVGFSNLLTSCWHGDPLCRPSFGQIMLELTHLMEEAAGKSLKRGFALHKDNSITKRSPPSSSWF